MFLWYKERLLRPSQIQRLLKHKYATDSYSLMDPYLQPWWEWFVTLLPMWVSPNLITIVGLAINLFSVLLLLIRCPSATENVLGLYPLLVAIGLFLYQTLDAADGKQARRTGSSNALGELFDHGCDSLSCLLLSTAGACAMGLGHIGPSILLGYCFFASFLFYAAHWQSYVTGRMRFGYIDVTEAQLTMIAILMATAFFGTEMWGYKVLGLFELRYVPLCTGMTLALFSLPGVINAILFDGAGKNGSTVAGTSVITPIIPLFMVLCPACYIAAYSPANVFRDDALIYVTAFGLIASKVSNKLIVAHMTKSELENMDTAFLGPFFMLINTWKGPFISEKVLLYALLIFVVVDYVLYCARICWDICEGTGWYLFKINSDQRSSASSATLLTGSRNGPGPVAQKRRSERH